ncbi:hypothetical protein AAJ76_100027871 [Vairimorpha ceranae]|uniref:Uncharacterized protein n=1 Tax=Vairimorpha ceranae TaxID=40302 RepID=A0A0F9WJA9_9MICR|nr:hypothetical protein AAJ76_100027871 [Vairimorpha ceranae]KKO76625.1 hypothetical protein AAJ76_100027871 [Vairimorpha ceranae]
MQHFNIIFKNAKEISKLLCIFYLIYFLMSIAEIIAVKVSVDELLPTIRIP